MFTVWLKEDVNLEEVKENIVTKLEIEKDDLTNKKKIIIDKDPLALPFNLPIPKRFVDCIVFEAKIPLHESFHEEVAGTYKREKDGTLAKIEPKEVDVRKRKISIQASTIKGIAETYSYFLGNNYSLFHSKWTRIEKL